MNRTRLVSLLVLPLVLTGCTDKATGAAPATASTERVEVVFTGGHDTDPRDKGRPVVLVAAALGVPTEVFRTAFSGVTPARAGEQAEAAQIGLNKAALLRVLAPYGITNERLDAVSNYYRYDASAGQSWPTRSAAAVATARDGRVVTITVTDAGAGYSSVPTVSVPGATGTAAADLAFGAVLRTNGSVATVRLTS